MDFELEKAKKLLEEKYNTQLEKIKKEFEDREDRDRKYKRVVENQVEGTKQKVDDALTVEKQKHEIEVKAEEIKQKLVEDKKRNDILLEKKIQDDQVKINEAKKKKADPDEKQNDLYGSGPDEEIKDAEEEIENIKVQKDKEIEKIEEQAK